MNAKEETNSKSLRRLTILEVASKLNFKCTVATKKWLDRKKVKIYKDSKPHYVFEIDVDCEIDKTRIKDLRVKYPNKWVELYREIAKDISVFSMVVLSLKGDLSIKPTTKVPLTTEDDNKLFKKLLE